MHLEKLPPTAKLPPINRHGSITANPQRVYVRAGGDGGVSDGKEVQEFSITLRGIPGWNTAPVQRLRLGLKVLLRAFGLRATSVKPLTKENNE